MFTRHPRPSLYACMLLYATACTPAEAPPPETKTVAEREDCAERNEHKRALFGDLHVHTAFSFDARSYHTVLTPKDAYRFARGEQVMLPPLDDAQSGTRPIQLDRPLDFAAATDHGEFLGEIALCTEPGSGAYDSVFCTKYRSEIGHGAFEFGFITSSDDPRRMEELCGEDGRGCQQAARRRWVAMQQAADDAYDRSANCLFSSFVAYEYTNTIDVSNLHRNVLFRNEVVVDMPITHLEAPSPLALWQKLDASCASEESPCDVLVLPHNSNLSNGNLFNPRYPGGQTLEAERQHAELRARMEPVVEVFQHKGDSECRNGFTDVNADEDPLCDFEKLRPKDDELCGEQEGSMGMRLWGCVHRHDFVRNVLSTGLLEDERLGINPYALGFIGSTDTHNGTPGFVRSDDFGGHIGLADDTSDKLLGSGTITHDTLINNPGGLAAVWAEENTRDAIFDAIRRKETFATSGPRIEVRFFGGWNLPETLCSADDAVSMAYDAGVPMGGTLPSLSPAANAPRFFVQATHDPGTPDHPGRWLERIQIIKSWTSSGQAFQRVYDVAGKASGDDVVDLKSCATEGQGQSTLCSVWTDPDFDPDARAYYYARVIEEPSCRWSTYECNRLTAEDRPESCSDPAIAKTVRHRAWSSPIWYRP